MAKKNRGDSDDAVNTLSPHEIIAQIERLARMMRQGSHTQGLVPVHWEALRYLARANRFSNSPGALARYLGSTKGTVSQTVLTLEKRGLIVKSSRGSDGRGLALTLTPAALSLLAKDPQQPLIAAAGDLSGKTAKRFARAVAILLAAEIERQEEPSFGSCVTCKHLTLDDGSIRCAAFHVALEDHELSQVCVEHAGG
jgi:DNA-binding MarR family transcriptional regulator